MKPGIEEINGYLSEEYTQPNAVLPEEGADKAEISLFISYAHDDRTLKNNFFGKIRTRLKSSKHYNFRFSSDRDILTGEDWNDRIQEMIQSCDFGLLLITSSFLASKYILEEELPKLLHKCLPVGLDILDLKNQDLKGLEEKQIYGTKRKPSVNWRSTI